MRVSWPGLDACYEDQGNFARATIPLEVCNRDTA